MTDTLTIAARFNGPPMSGNGGYLCGLLAQSAATPASTVTTVTLRRPPPLEQALDVVKTSDQLVELRDDNKVVADAVPSADTPPIVDAVEPSMVAAAEQAYRGMTGHPFPTCFVCGTHRAPGDGLRLRPGPVSERPDMTACAWTPDASLVDPASGRVRAEFVWAALDCPGAWTLDISGRPMVLGRMTGLVDAEPQIGDACMVMGHLLGREGRKAFTATTLYGANGVVLGRASAIWLEVDPRIFSAGSI